MTNETTTAAPKKHSAAKKTEVKQHINNFAKQRRKYKLADDLVKTTLDYKGVRLYRGERYVADVRIAKRTFFLTSTKDPKIAAALYDAFVLAAYDDVEDGALNFPASRKNPTKLNDKLKAKAAEAKKLLA